MDAEKIRDINDYNALYGYKDFNIYKLDDNMLNAVYGINDLAIPEFNSVCLPYIKKRDLFKKAKCFYASKLLLHDVGFMSNRMLTRLIRKNNISSIDELVSIYNASAAYVSPYKIPVEFSRQRVFSGTLETQIVVFENHEVFSELLPKLSVFFNKIFLAKKPTDIGVCCYVHELMHSQLQSQKGIVDNYYDSEVFSIFFELLCAYENHDYYLYALVARINKIFLSFNNMYLYQTDQKDKIEKPNYELYDFCNDGKYLISTLKAFSLLDKYINGSYGDKKNILLRMQSVIDGVVHSSSFLENMDVTYDSILDPDITKSLLSK